MSTPVQVLSYSLVGNTKLTRCRGAFQIPARRQPQVFKEDELQLHFWEENRFFLNAGILLLESEIRLPFAELSSLCPRPMFSMALAGASPCEAVGRAFRAKRRAGPSKTSALPGPCFEIQMKPFKIILPGRPVAPDPQTQSRSGSGPPSSLAAAASIFSPPAPGPDTEASKPLPGSETIPAS